ncbi:dCTP deaminase domain-containing protein [Chromobacterium violaceum]|uniref:dCTP deaminase domain-containing protein n=1 Tax=Chromobacterium violaceum TaxID=536 RepID=UPI001B32D446|nr:hypothetical protein [Chromobacterium violaceum]MBP4043949.1 hypothetical protein [Chromobacterium violaceum]
MTFLSREEIIDIFISGNLKIEVNGNPIKNYSHAPYSKTDPFQQCSLDLHVGAIYLPETKDSEKGGIITPLTDEHTLNTGETILIQTKEKITLPINIGAICFAPSRIALKGVIITNMGHVDPGYSGHLHFTAINMGNSAYNVRVGTDIVCTMLLFRINPTAPAYGDEHSETVDTINGQKKIPGAVYYSLPKLARDFANFEKRSEKAAKDEVDKAKVWQYGAPLIGTLVIGILGYIQNIYLNNWKPEVEKLNTRIEQLQQNSKIEKRLQDIENSLAKAKAKQ